MALITLRYAPKPPKRAPNGCHFTLLNSVSRRLQQFLDLQVGHTTTHGSRGAWYGLPARLRLGPADDARPNMSQGSCGLCCSQYYYHGCYYGLVGAAIACTADIVSMAHIPTVAGSFKNPQECSLWSSRVWFWEPDGSGTLAST